MNGPVQTGAATTLLLLGDDDDVLIATRDLTPGPHRASDGSEIEVQEPIRLGHKVARRPLPVGTRVLRYGVPIGSMVAAAERGAWVHVHNLGSDYIATFAAAWGLLVNADRATADDHLADDRPIVGYLRADGRVGIRNVTVVVYTVECARMVADAIAVGLDDVHVIGFGGCYPSDYAHRMLDRLTTHPNVGAVVLVSLGCEGFDRERLASVVAATMRPVTTVVIQDVGGTKAAVSAGRDWIAAARDGLDAVPRKRVGVADLIVGTICGGSDGTSGITANPVVGRVFDRVVESGGTAVFEESGELIGCEHHMAGRAVTSELADEIVARIGKAADYYAEMGHGSFSPGNAEGGLTTLEEKALGAYSKSGTGPIHGIVTPGQQIPAPGLYLLDVVPEGAPRWGYPNINDNAEIAELIASGAHIVLFTTGRGSVVGSTIAPVVKVCANPDTFRRMPDDMDVDAGRILEGRSTIDDVAAELFDTIVATAAGRPSASEELGHREFVLTYKSSEPTGPSCLPTIRRR